MAVQPPPERFRDVLEACAQGFGAPRFSDASAEREQTVWELDRAWVVEDDGRYVATATSYAFEMTVPGGTRVPAGGVAQVAVLPTHRRRGHLRDVMGAVLAPSAELGEHDALLNAYDSGIYGRLGVGQADRIAPAPPPGGSRGFFHPPRHSTTHRACAGALFRAILNYSIERFNK